MARTLVNVSATIFALMLIVRALFTYIYPGKLPFNLAIIDWLVVIAGSGAAISSIFCFIKKRYPDTAEFLPMFSTVCYVIVLIGYAILRYTPAYQTSLSIMVTGMLVGMGWWIQCITSAANTRRSHTLNMIINTRTSPEYQKQLRNSTKFYRGMRYVPQELSEWRCNPDKEEYKNMKVPDEYRDAINGLLYILNYFEFLAQGIKFKDLDDELLKECFSSFLRGIERRGFHMILESQKQDPAAFEGIIYLSKKWNGTSFVETHRSNPNTFGEKIAHGTTFRRAVEEGLLDLKRVVQIGQRAQGYAAGDFQWGVDQGFRLVQAEQCWHTSLAPLMAEVRQQMGDGPVYLSFDIDSLDPIWAPGTGTPEVGGLTSIQALEIVRGCRGLNLIGADLVEVSPPYDVSGNTSQLAANLLYEMLCVLPGVKYA